MQLLTKPVVGYEGLYEINSEGEIFSVDKWVSRRGRGGVEHTFFRKGRKLTHKIRDLYPAIVLYKNKRKKNFNIHRLVAEAFIPNPEGYTEVNHKDENKHNPRASNLEWCTKSYNQAYSRSKECCFVSPSGEEVRAFNLKEFCRDNKLNPACVWRLFNGRQLQTKGWRLKFNPF